MEINIVLTGDPALENGDIEIPYEIGHFGSSNDAVVWDYVRQLDTLAQDLQHDLNMVANGSSDTGRITQRLVGYTFHHDISARKLTVGIHKQGTPFHALIIDASSLSERLLATRFMAQSQTASKIA